jgi:transcriptional regulator with XRE-family HTH domain
MLIGRQIRAARGILGWSARETAERSGLSLPTIQRLEKYEGISPTVQERTLNDLKRAFEMAGVEFIGTPEDRPGVRFKALEP